MTFRLFLFLLGTTTLGAQHSDTSLQNPFQTPQDRIRGGQFYLEQCASCHGFDGKGGASGPNISTGNFRHATTDESLFRVITKGIPGTSMPGFSMNGRELWQIISFIRGLSFGRTGVASGDPKAGEQLFQSNRCLNCHWLNGTGAPVGPDLSSIGIKLSIADIQISLTDPSTEVAPEYWSWKATTKTGQPLRGSRLNEDTFSLQILDQNGRLRSIAKSDLQHQSLDRHSPMPSFKDKLNTQQLTDLVAYLVTLHIGVAK